MSLYELWQTTKNELERLQTPNNSSTIEDLDPNSRFDDACKHSLSYEEFETVYTFSPISEQALETSDLPAEQDNPVSVVHTTYSSSVPISEPVLEPSDLPAEEDDPLKVVHTMPSLSVSISEPAHSELPAEKTIFLDQTTPASSQPGTSSGYPVTGVASPFKRHLFYKNPTENPPKKRATQEKMPTIVSGRNFQEYLQKKTQKKEELEKAKNERIAERKKKREEKAREKEAKKLSRKAKNIKKKRFDLMQTVLTKKKHQKNRWKGKSGNT